MNQLRTALTEGIIAFAATNIDDIFILVLFFTQVDTNFRRRHIIIGQYLGFLGIILASLPGFFGGLVVRREWIGLLGILPILIGLKQLLSGQPETTEVQTVSNNFSQTSPSNFILSFIWTILHPQTYKVAAVTIANGGDNISIYIPLFAGHTLASLGVILTIFLVMVGIWCAIAYYLSLHPAIASILNRYGHHIVPFVLIGLGLLIMYERGTFTLLPWLK
jgi:cadmium resistance transport/sequestration family protein